MRGIVRVELRGEGCWGSEEFLAEVGKDGAMDASGGFDTHGFPIPLHDVSKSFFEKLLAGNDGVESLHPFLRHGFVAALVAGGYSALAIPPGRPHGLEGVQTGSLADDNFLGPLGKSFRQLSGFRVFIGFRIVSG